MTSLTVAEWLARTLARNNVDHVFFIDAVMRRTLVEMEQVGIKRILVHSEKAAAYMADGYARVRSAPGLCFSQAVGAANLAAGLQDAFLAQSPVIAITGRKVLSYRYRNAYQEVPHQPLFSAVTKFTGDVDRASDVPRVFGYAWRTALANTPGPVHLDFDGLMGERVERGTIDAPIGSGISPGPAPMHRTLANETELAAAIARLKGSKRLAIVAGTGAMLSNAGRELLTVAESFKAPIATSLGARGIVPTRHPLSVGTVGNYSAAPANQTVSEADVVLFVGCRTGDQVTLDWQVPSMETPIVHLDIDPLEIGRNYPNTVGICGDPKMCLARLREMAGNLNRDMDFAETAARRMDAWRASVRPALTDNSAPIKVERLCHEIGDALPADAILVADTGYSSIWTCTHIELNGAGQTYLRAAGSLGWSFPAAMGAQCAAPERRVLCFIGDGGFYYHLPELETARRYKIPIVVIVNNNSGFGQSITGIRAAQGETPGNPDELGCFGPLNFAKIAESFGVHGIRVERPPEIAEALSKAISLKEPVVIDVATDIEPRAPTPWKPVSPM
ncbi:MULTISPECIES: thiamine pyrophosphate-binding protein [unclassified Mesorhizobium]|uniref:thiamine pyrophosphate-binding protein n=1 Tax=unclassified Mesorhizobium TaxID=325217 RepID=UPI0015E2CBC5|nr:MULTISPECIES: thiamine pyrophosphate-binding protein [unclassified Mesorhizobium]